MNKQRNIGQCKDDKVSIDLPTSLIVALVVMATLVVVGLFATL